MNADRLLAHYERIADAPDAIARMRRFILDLAVRGKLVPQNPNDEPASELLKRIAKEKARLVKAGEIRKLKASEPIQDDEHPIKLPGNWAWARLCEIGKLSGGMTPSMNRSDFWEGDIVWLSPKDIKSDEVADSELKISALGLAETRLELYRPGCLFMVARSGILKRTFPVSINRVPAAANQDMKVLAPFLDGQERYLQIMFRGLTDFLLRELVKTGTTVQSLKYAEFEQQPFPLPPLAEQHRIVAKVDELMALCARLEAARGSREATRDRLTAASLARLNAPDPSTFHDDARFALHALPALTTRPDQIKQLRQTILNLAVRGKLVPQDPNDEPASELVRRIILQRKKHPKGRRVTEPTVAKPNLLKSIGWASATMSELAIFENGDRSSNYPSGSDILGAGIPFFSTKNISDYKLGFSNLDFISAEKFASLRSGKLQDGDIVITLRGSVGKFGAFRANDKYRTGFINAQLLIVRSFIPEFIDFLLMFMKSEAFSAQLDTRSSGSATPQLSAGQLAQVDIPVPPLAEQNRIVAKVDALMALCDRLEASLTASADTRRRLLDALLAEALAPTDARELMAAE